MKSYACIDRFEGKYAVCEVELHPIEESLQLNPSDKETVMIDVPHGDVLQLIYSAHEGDIFVVEHNSCTITAIYKKDDEEKQRRTDLISSLMNE